MKVTQNVFLPLSQISQIPPRRGLAPPRPTGTHQQAFLPSSPTLFLAGLQNRPRACVHCSPAWEKLPISPTEPEDPATSHFSPTTFMPHPPDRPHLAPAPFLCPVGLLSLSAHSQGPSSPLHPILSSGAFSAQNSPSSSSPPIFLPWHPKESPPERGKLTVKVHSPGFLGIKKQKH